MSTATNEHHDLHPSAELSYQMSKLGMWAFLITEIMLFSGMFVTFAVYRYRFTEMFSEGGSFLSVPFGAVNTIVLLTSSFTVAWAVDAIKRNKMHLTVWLLTITVALAGTFMINKFFEYSHKTHEVEMAETNLVPAYAESLKKDGKCTNGKCLARPFQPQNIGSHAASSPVFANVFFTQYFVMTGIHGLHVIIGMGLFIWIIFLGLKGRLTSNWFTPVEVGGLYWHLVDLIWIYLFPMLYLLH